MGAVESEKDEESVGDTTTPTASAGALTTVGAGAVLTSAAAATAGNEEDGESEAEDEDEDEDEQEEDGAVGAALMEASSFFPTKASEFVPEGLEGEDCFAAASLIKEDDDDVVDDGAGVAPARGLAGDDVVVVPCIVDTGPSPVAGVGTTLRGGTGGRAGEEAALRLTGAEAGGEEGEEEEAEEEDDLAAAVVAAVVFVVLAAGERERR